MCTPNDVCPHIEIRKYNWVSLPHSQLAPTDAARINNEMAKILREAMTGARGAWPDLRTDLDGSHDRGEGGVEPAADCGRPAEADVTARPHDGSPDADR